MNNAIYKSRNKEKYTKIDHKSIKLKWTQLVGNTLMWINCNINFAVINFSCIDAHIAKTTKNLLKASILIVCSENVSSHIIFSMCSILTGSLPPAEKAIVIFLLVDSVTYCWGPAATNISLPRVGLWGLEELE